MDKDVLDQRLSELCQTAMAEARAAVTAAPDGQWIAASEWQVREIFQRLTQDCYQAMLQAKADEHASAESATFSPDERCGPWGGAAKQGRARSKRFDGGRRD
jgi:hypothetical protein